MYKFIFTFIETNEDGIYWGYETSKRKVEIFAKDKYEALKKLKEIGINHYINLQWDAVEIIGGEKNGK